MIQKITKFFHEVAGELKKVSWSTRNELKGATLLVLLSSAILGVYIGMTDFVLSKLLGFIIR